MDHILLLKLVTLLAAANGAPVLAKKLLKQRWSWPVDCGLTFPDGKPLLGQAKTCRGLLFSIFTTAVVAWLLGLPLLFGVVFAAASMAGDLFSSFIKRRLGLKSSSMALGLDQIPEALFPLLVCKDQLAITDEEILAVVAVFFWGELYLSRLLYRLHWRDRPY